MVKPNITSQPPANAYFVLLFQEIEVGGGRKAIIIFVPVPQLKSFQKIQVRLVRELEKKFSGKHVVFIAQVKNPLELLKCWLEGISGGHLVQAPTCSSVELPIQGNSDSNSLYQQEM